MSIQPMARAGTLNSGVAEEMGAVMGRYRVSGAELARRLGVSQMWVSDRLRGTTQITVADLERIASALNVTIMDLMPRSVREQVTVTDPKTAHIDHSRSRPPGHPFESVRPMGARRPIRTRQLPVPA